MSDNNEETTAVEQTASETSAQVAQGATDYGYVSSGNDSGNVRLIKNYALFLFPQGDSTFVAPDGVNWTPPSNKKPIGYSTEDGAVLHPEPGDSTDYKAHNGDIVLSDTDPGYWTLQLAAMEGRKDVVSAYFDVDVESDGGISIKGAGLKKEWILVLVALDQQDRPFVRHQLEGVRPRRREPEIQRDHELQHDVQDAQGRQGRAVPRLGPRHRRRQVTH